MIEQVAEGRHPGQCDYCGTWPDSVVVLKRISCSMVSGHRNVRRVVRYYERHHPNCPMLSDLFT